MTAFSPTTTTIDPPGQSDDLASAVLAGLSRPIVRRAPWGILKTAVFSVLTFGLAPILSWPARLRNACLREQQQLWHLSEWLRLNSGRPDALPLRNSTSSLAYRHGLDIAGKLVLVLGLLGAWGKLTVAAGPFPMRWSMPLIFRSMYDRMHFVNGQMLFTRWNVDPALVHFSMTWTGILTVIFFLHWLQLQLHVGDMRMYLIRFNAIATAHGLKPVAMPHTGIGLRPLWIVAAIILWSLGVGWALPLMIAGAVQNRYIGKTSYIVRHELAQRMTQLVATQNPTAAVTAPMRLWSCCTNPRCGALFPPTAKFCPRCGTGSAPRV